MYSYPQRTYSDPTPRRPRRMFFVGVFSILMGIMVLMGVCIYAAFGIYNKSNLQNLNTAIQGPVSLPEQASVSKTQIHRPLVPEGTSNKIEIIRNPQPVVKDEPNSGYAPAAVIVPTETETSPPVEEAAPTVSSGDPVEPVKATAQASETVIEGTPGPMVADVEFDARELVLVYNTTYPGHRIHPKYWDRPLKAGADDYTYGVVPIEDGFLEVASDNGLPKGSLSDAVHIRIPSIGVDSEVANLSILDLGDSRQYETPAHVVGRIPETSNPGETGNTWLFGHLESPIRGEGNVFRRLPEIPEILKNGDPVYVTLLNTDGEEFMYQVTSTNVVHRDNLSLYQTEDSTITLVTCVPRLIYDQRLVVSGKLVGVRKPA